MKPWRFMRDTIACAAQGGCHERPRPLVVSGMRVLRWQHVVVVGRSTQPASLHGGCCGHGGGRPGRVRARGGAGDGARKTLSHRRPPSSVAADLHRRIECRQFRRSPDEELDAGKNPWGYGQGGGRGRDALGDHAGPQFHVRRSRAKTGARMQRLRRQTGSGPSRPLRQFRDDPADGYRGQPARDRLCAGHAEGRRHRPDDELRRQMARRSLVSAGHGRAQPAQGAGLHPSDRRQLLRQPGQDPAAP